LLEFSHRKDDTVIRQFLNNAFIIEINSEIKLKAVEIRKQTKIKLPDAIIASTAIVYKMSLITRNTNDFSKIGSLEVVNPFSL
jgi:predicted nucleic acid-binding protein